MAKWSYFLCILTALSDINLCLFSLHSVSLQTERTSLLKCSRPQLLQTASTKLRIRLRGGEEVSEFVQDADNPVDIEPFTTFEGHTKWCLSFRFSIHFMRNLVDIDVRNSDYVVFISVLIGLLLFITRP